MQVFIFISLMCSIFRMNTQLNFTDVVIISR